jgi:hypothetical protein
MNVSKMEKERWRILREIRDFAESALPKIGSAPTTQDVHDDPKPQKSFRDYYESAKENLDN